MNDDFNQCSDDASGGTAPEPRLRNRVREQTRVAILAAAEEVLGADGLDARIEAIAGRAEVSVRTLYNYFGDRDDIVRAVLQRNQTELHEALDRALQAPAPDFAQSVQHFAAAAIEHFLRHGAFMAAVMQQRMRDKDFVERRKLFMGPLRARAQILVGRGVREGLVRSDDDERIASFLLSVCQFEFVDAVCDGHRDPDVAAVVTFFLHGAASRP